SGTIRSIYTEHLAPEHQAFYQALDSLKMDYKRSWDPKRRIVLYPTQVTHNEVMDGTLTQWLAASHLDTIQHQD
ncbi:MAG: hypothetical protein CO167_08120, partial [Candidatus Marinimicrobia bacterium CG_4_9_14_3_um_filter_48_9]